MISTIKKSNCCGCSACQSACPKHCITMEEDSEGFLYPSIDKDRCIDCHICEKVCPMTNVRDERRPLSIYAFKHKSDEVRERSSSGGMFSLLAEYVLNHNGVVFGAGFDETWEVVHKYIEYIEDLDELRRSKYVQSRIGETYTQAEDFLKAGRLVLFAGTPCQIAGLRNFLRKEYPNLLAMDFVCHSVPSPKVWRKYLNEECARKGAAGKNSVFQSLKLMPLIKGVNFRDKSEGWKKYSFSLSLAKATAEGEKNTVFRSVYHDNLYMNFFMSDTISRPSCFDCKCKSGRSCSDCTVADYWWINELHSDFDDDKGCSLVYVNTEKAQTIIDGLQENGVFLKTDTKDDIEKAYLFEGAYSTPAKPNKTRDIVFNSIDSQSLEELRPYSEHVKTLKEKTILVIKKLVKHLGVFEEVKQLYKKIR